MNDKARETVAKIEANVVTKLNLSSTSTTPIAPSPRVTPLYPAGNEIGDAGAVAFGKVLEQNTTLTKLYLHSTSTPLIAPSPA